MSRDQAPEHAVQRVPEAVPRLPVEPAALVLAESPCARAFLVFGFHELVLSTRPE